MLEIVLLFFLCRNLGERLRAKGRTPIGYQIGLVVLWFGSEVTVGFIYGIISAIQSSGQEPTLGIGAYLIAIVAAALSAVAMFTLVHFLPPVGYAEYDPDVGNPYRSPNN